jgi:NitT/TauT family transport system ATP-binding protein
MPTLEEPVVQVSGAQVTYRMGGKKTLTALDNVDLTVNRGEFVALLGPSGCGKSTLLRTLAGLEAPTAGSVLIDGLPPVEIVRQHNLGIAFQDHALLPWLTIWQNLALPFRVARRLVDRERVAQLISLVGLTGFERARPSQLSGGMRQRASLARALMLEPKMLLLDEPFGALDPVTRRQLYIQLQQIWTALTATTLLVTHDVHEALFLADRVVVMSGRPGRIKSSVVVPFSRPRGPNIQRNATFHHLVDMLTEMLDDGSDRVAAFEPVR